MTQNVLPNQPRASGGNEIEHSEKLERAAFQPLNRKPRMARTTHMSGCEGPTVQIHTGIFCTKVLASTALFSSLH